MPRHLPEYPVLPTIHNIAHSSKLNNIMQQSILFTIIPRGIAINTDTLPVSIIVSPRLSDGTLLYQFPDWLNWTERVQRNGLALTIQCKNDARAFKIPVEQLRPDLWQAIFKENTRVNPFVFQDFTDRGVYSYSVRRVMSALKETYQQAGLFLGLPEENFQVGRKGAGRRGLLEQMVQEYGVRWDNRVAKQARETFRHQTRRRYCA